MLAFVSVNTPAELPVFSMSTVPLAESSGLRPETSRIVSPSSELECDMVPAVTMLPGLADVEVKLAPEATAIMATSDRTKSAETIFRGDSCQRAEMRCMMFGPFLSSVEGGSGPVSVRARGILNLVLRRPSRLAGRTTALKFSDQSIRRRSTAQRLSSWRFESCSLRSTAETCASTVFAEIWSLAPISL